MLRAVFNAAKLPHDPAAEAQERSMYPVNEEVWIRDDAFAGRMNAEFEHELTGPAQDADPGFPPVDADANMFHDWPASSAA